MTRDLPFTVADPGTHVTVEREFKETKTVGPIPVGYQLVWEVLPPAGEMSATLSEGRRAGRWRSNASDHPPPFFRVQ